MTGCLSRDQDICASTSSPSSSSPLVCLAVPDKHPNFSGWSVEKSRRGNSRNLGSPGKLANSAKLPTPRSAELASRTSAVPKFQKIPLILFNRTISAIYLSNDTKYSRIAYVCVILEKSCSKHLPILFNRTIYLSNDTKKRNTRGSSTFPLLNIGHGPVEMRIRGRKIPFIYVRSQIFPSVLIPSVSSS